jgi:hypothetical protein
MSEWYIDPEWLRTVQDTSFFYPCAYLDHDEAIEVFADHVKTFVFCDNYYPVGLKLDQAIPAGRGARLIDCQIEGAPNATIESRTDPSGRPYRFLLPSKRIETYEREDGRTFVVIRRRGFGQIALSTEIPDRSIGVFMHRGDSPGEGGSGVYFLGNRGARYAPLGRLFDTLACRLTDRALVITDGSNCELKSLRKRLHHTLGMNGQEAFGNHQDQGTPLVLEGFLWSCVGWLRKGPRGPTLIWGLTRQTA